MANELNTQCEFLIKLEKIKNGFLICIVRDLGRTKEKWYCEKANRMNKLVENILTSRLLEIARLDECHFKDLGRI